MSETSHPTDPDAARDWTLEMQDPPGEGIAEGLRACLLADAERKMAAGNDRRHWAWVARDGEARLIGGLTAELSWSWLYVRLLWVNEPWRGLGIGEALMRAAEDRAAAAGAIGALVDTADFQAPGFYQRLSYTVFGTVEDLPPGCTTYYLKKSLGA